MFELPPVEPIVTEYQQHALDCRLCNHRTIGVLVTDRHGAYPWWPNCRRQFCWAHLKRDIQTIVEREGESGRIGEGMLDEVERMLTWWHRVRDGTLARSSFRIYMRTVQKRFEATADGRGGGVPPQNEQDVRDAALAPPRPLDLRVHLAPLLVGINPAPRYSPSKHP